MKTVDKKAQEVMDKKARGARLKYFRIECLKQNNAAKFVREYNLGYSKAYFSRLEAGTITVPFEYLIFLKRTFNFSMDWGITGEGAPFTSQAHTDKVSNELKEISKPQ